MNRKGFTLAELLGIVVIISLLSIIAVPTILRKFKEEDGKITEATESVLTSAANIYITTKYTDVKTNGRVMCVKINDMIESGILEKPIFDSNSKEIDYNQFVKVSVNDNLYNYDITATCEEK